MAALHQLNAETCDCGCKYTLAPCRISDPACKTSKERPAAINKFRKLGLIDYESGSGLQVHSSLLTVILHD